jgi:hypothetical protein
MSPHDGVNTSTQTKLDWYLLAAMGVTVPALILFLRLTVMCPFLEVKAFDFLPFVWVGSGCIPHWFSRAMHNLTHPVVLLSYGIIFAYLALRPVGRALPQRTSRWLTWSLLAIHALYFLSYSVSIFLPRTMTWVISMR